MLCIGHSQASIRVARTRLVICKNGIGEIRISIFFVRKSKKTFGQMKAIIDAAKWPNIILLT